MKNSNATDSQGSPDSEAPQLSPWQQLKSKRIAYLTLPLLVMATIVEFVILATGWKYQQMVCLPQGMGVTFFGIGPIGATILAVELLKLPLAIWTASRVGWQKGFMLIVGLPLICVLTFQLVKDMAVYEMGTAMAPASQMLEKAAAEETKIVHLNGELVAIEQKKADRELKLAQLAAKQAKAKAELEESLKRNDATRQDAITLTDYQKKELSEAEARQTTIIRQFDADAVQLAKAITDLRTRRETELARATTWNAEEARIENAYKAKLAAYTNKKTAYEKDKTEYDNANFLRRQLMKEPVDPGVPPERESNKILKPTLVAEIEEQIKAKESELIAVNNKRRDGVAQVGADARRLREDFDRRSGTKREQTDSKREELLAAIALLVKDGAAEAKQIDQELAAAVQKVDGIRAEVDASRKKAEGFYEAREASIKNTQVHRIATTVEIVRGLLFGERPMSIKATSKERGDILTDQISMVRIWVYPVLAFIVAFLPTLMVEIGFSTVFKPEQQRPPHRLGFFGRGLHWLYIRAGRQKILRAERLASTASAEIAARDKALAVAQATAEKALTEKEAELQAAHEAMAIATARHAEQSKKKEDRYEEELQTKEDEWVAKFSGMADSLNRAIIEKDALRDLQKSEIERQIQMRQNAWSDRLTQLRQELDDQRTASESERTALMQEHHKKLLEVSEECKTQVIQARRQMADAELTSVEKSARLAHDLKEALHARDIAESQLKHQADSLSAQLSQAKEDGAREIEKAARQEKHRLERQQSEFEKALRQRDEDFEHRLQQREQELSLTFDACLAEEKTKVEQDSRRREVEIERQFEARAREVDTRWNQEVQQREDATQIRLKQQEQQLRAQAEVRLGEVQTQAEQELRRRELEFERQIDAQSRDAETRLREELQQKEVAFHAKMKQREQELTNRSADRETQLQNQWVSDLRAREEAWEHQAESRIRAVETRLSHEAQQKDEIFQIKLRQREQQLQSQFDGRQAELKAQWDQELRNREVEWDRNAEAGARGTEARLMAEMQQKDELFQSKLRQRDQQWQAKLDTVRVELQAQTEQEVRRREMELAEIKQREQELVVQLTEQVEVHQMAEKQWETELEITRGHIEPIKALLARAEKDRDEAVQSASESIRQAQDMEKKLTEASSLLTGWKNGKGSAGSRGGRDSFQVARGGLGESSEL
ncbi:MAG TPA: hypothetical protein VK846_16785 [Candidatus Limnocylindria bacterium]|nr:hypothetical protein [Candidatus Limnocylindria bacterium]